MLYLTCAFYIVFFPLLSFFCFLLLPSETETQMPCQMLKLKARRKKINVETKEKFLGGERGHLTPLDPPSLRPCRIFNASTGGGNLQFLIN
jgi:hypothetical protein